MKKLDDDYTGISVKDINKVEEKVRKESGSPHHHKFCSDLIEVSAKCSRPGHMTPPPVSLFLIVEPRMVRLSLPLFCLCMSACQR